MTISHLSLTNFRNILSAELTPCAGVNFIYGANGSGKTSILEALSVLGMGRSFRSHKYKTLINNDSDALTVFSRLTHSDGRLVPVGVSRQRSGDSTFKVDGSNVTSAAALAAHLPIQVINSHTFDLLEGSPKSRRQFIDWLVFHVEPQFYNLWKAAQRCLKHRNSLLRRDRIERLEVTPWDVELCSLTEAIEAYRQQTLVLFQAEFDQLVSEFVAVDGLSLSYQRGWDADIDYSEHLNQNFERDCQSGYTRAGVHRADIRIKVGRQLAVDILSRGQQKLLVCAMKIAQGLVFHRQTGRHCIYLVDDLPAELDPQYRQLLAHWLDKMDSQVFVTGVEQKTLVSSWQDIVDTEKRVFHVEHGKVTQVDV